jgi:6-phosphofructokinase 1
VVAEGAGQDLMRGGNEIRDASGNLLKKDIGVFLKDAISKHFKSKGMNVPIKYFDPSYSIRSAPAQGTDAILCYLLAKEAVHAAMRGKTKCVVGTLNGVYSLVPIELATMERQQVNLRGPLWRAVLDATQQETYFGRAAK